jgi:glycosyltransferase involved in cell wall biosynthesis
MIAIAAPNHYIGDILAYYKRERAALFVSQNTDTLAKEHIETIAMFGHVLVPSSWCLRVVEHGLLDLADAPDVQLHVLPLGVDESFVAARKHSPYASEGQRIRALHLTTDQCWPGRKGTEELLEAWALLMRRTLGTAGEATMPMLTIHAPLALERDLLYRIADLDLMAYVTLVVDEERGVVATRLSDLYREHDVVILPSRCEGFGMMILAALVAGVPLITTYVTGQTDFLSQRGGWLSVPTFSTGEMAYESGSAPVVEVPPLVNLLEFALSWPVIERLRSMCEPDDWGTWLDAMGVWLERLRMWTTEETTT